MTKRVLVAALAAGLTIATAATTAAAELLAGREPVARAGAGEHTLLLPLRGAFDVLFVGDCVDYSPLGGEQPEITAEITGYDLKAIELPSGEVVSLDLAPAPYYIWIEGDEPSACTWALFLDPR